MALMIISLWLFGGCAVAIGLFMWLRNQARLAVAESTANLSRKRDESIAARDALVERFITDLATGKTPFVELVQQFQSKHEEIYRKPAAKRRWDWTREELARGYEWSIAATARQIAKKYSVRQLSACISVAIVALLLATITYGLFERMEASGTAPAPVLSPALQPSSNK